jgi:hypothetical protein
MASMSAAPSFFGRRCPDCGFTAGCALDVVQCPYGYLSCPIVTSLAERAARKSLQILSAALIVTSLIILVLVVFLAAAGFADASECYSLRELSQRQACLARERGDPNDCLGVRDSDQRILCRRDAEHERHFLDRDRRLSR